MPLGNTTLITRCPHCHTAFRAAPEQLAARDGHVRCGHCGMVFDARAHLLDPETLLPLEPATASTTPLTAGSGAVEDSRTTDETPDKVANADSDPADTPETAHPEEDARSDARPLAEEGNDNGAQPWSSSDATDHPQEAEPATTGADTTLSPFDHGPAQPSPDEMQAGAVAPMDLEAPIDGAPSSTARDSVAAPVDAHDAALPADSFTGHESIRDTHPPVPEAGSASASPMAIAAKAATPAGLPHATTEALFDAPPRPGSAARLSPWVSWPALVVLLLVLAGQVTFRYRGDLVLLFPGLRPWAEMACSPFNCDIPLPQRAELMSIESSDLQADSTNPGVMVLSATLRNRAPFAQMPPALELTLTDTQDQPVARRVLTAADYFARSGPALASGNALFPAGAELPVKVFFEASALKATGYRLYLFYP